MGTKRRTKDNLFQAWRLGNTASAMRSDPYQGRARELCQAAGIDPDSRIGEGRGRPAWTDYRDAARAEQVAAVQAMLAATTKQNPSAPTPVILGQHDEGTIGQMKNCMRYGNVAAGVICADGHLGYAQPVGGIIGYRDQISISGVGFDIACGNMAVRLDTTSPESVGLLYSTVHGAGRVRGRKEAKRRFQRAEMDDWLRARGVMLAGADLDESPMAYRRLPEVLAAHANTIKILHTLRPFAVAMAGAGEFDPFKD